MKYQAVAGQFKTPGSGHSLASDYVRDLTAPPSKDIRGPLNEGGLPCFRILSGRWFMRVA